MVKVPFKINQGDLKPQPVEVREGEREKKREEEKERTAQGIEKFYHDQEFSKIQKPVLFACRSIWLVLIAAIVVAGLAGGLAGFFILSSGEIKLPFLKPVNLTKFFPTREINLVTEKKITVTNDLRVAEMIRDLSPQLVKIFLAKPETTEKSTPFLNQIYLDEDALGLGFILTSDGWIVTHQNVVPTAQKKYLVTIERNKNFLVEKIITDSSTGIVFLKIKTEGLPVTRLNSRAEINLGQQVLVFGSSGGLLITEINQIENQKVKKADDLVRSSDKLETRILLSQNFERQFLGSPVFGLDKGAVGLVVGQPGSGIEVLPSHFITPLISQVLKGEKISHPFLGIDYLDLSQAIGLTDPRFKEFERGALVYGPPLKGSPAEKAGIKNGDIIIKVDNQIINETNSLTDLIQTRQPGDEIEITFVREGTEKTVKVKLGKK